jgi:hypothetical protein
MALLQGLFRGACNPLFLCVVSFALLYLGMSITEWPQEQEPSQVRLAKALSWHYPNREYFNSLFVEKYRRERGYVISHFQQQNSHLDGLIDHDKHQNRRIRLGRFNSFTPPKSTTKTSGLNPAICRVSEFFV